jgi:hypothetical protein
MMSAYHLAVDGPRCWNCGSTALLVEPDPDMAGMTDRCVCDECRELQPEPIMEEVLRDGADA